MLGPTVSLEDLWEDFKVKAREGNIVLHFPSKEERTML
jgi:hypothetical protein